MEEQRPGRRQLLYGLVAALLLAGVWRIVVAAALPAISRDCVTFCWYARALGEQGLGYLKTSEAQQHPLFPALILAVQRAARFCGATDSPLCWQRCGQLVAWLGGMGVVALSGALAGRLVRQLQLPLHAGTATVLAMLMAALLDRNVWLSADVMSDQVHLAFYLAAVWLALGVHRAPAALLCGLLSGLAFLTRQEGFVPAGAALLALAVQARRLTWRVTALRAGAVVFGFLICAAPYWALVGRFSTKKDIRDLVQTEARADDALVRRAVPPRHDQPQTTSAPPSVAGRTCAHYGPIQARPSLTATASAVTTLSLPLGKLERVEHAWYELVPLALYKLLRAGRVVVPVLAFLPLLNLRRRWLRYPLVAVTACLCGHFALTLLLLRRYGYLDARHTLVDVMLLVPFAAMLLTRVFQLFWDSGRRRPAVIITGICLLPLAVYALRIPNAKDRFLVDAARWLAANDPEIATKRLLGGSSTRRIAFYADMHYQQWYERQADYDELRGQIRDGGLGYFALELEGPSLPGSQFERLGNRALVEKLRTDAQVAPRLRLVHTQPGPDGSELLIFEIHPGDRAEPACHHADTGTRTARL